ncbi:MAG TPA: GGDEF domain-containing protein, partial [Thermoanaerobaculia bacterium]
MPTQTTTAIGFQLLGPVSVALLLFQIHRSFRTRYILHWTLSFGALTIFHAGTAALALPSDHPSQPFALLAASLVGGAAAYLQLGWFVWGSVELCKRKAVKVAEPQRILILLAGVGVLSGAIPFFVGRDPAVHRFFYVGLHALGAALTFVVCGMAVRRFRGAGFTVASIAMVIYGFVQLDQFITVMRSVVGKTSALPLLALGISELAGCAIVALGMVLIVLEDQREASALASSQVEQLAYYDTLTGLPNRALFGDRLTVALGHAARHRYKLAVLFLDVDRFKQINDSLGHTIGDRLLKIVAARIRSAIREEDTVARFGGDEFTILIHIIGKIEDAGKIAQKILDSLKTPITIDERDFVVTSSIGISIYPIDGADGETLIRNADTAMYRAKDLGRNTFQFYAATMNH